MFVKEDPKQFIRSERVIGDVSSGGVYRGQYAYGKTLTKNIAKQGHEQPVFTNVGRWRTVEQAEKRAAVYVPWLTIDIDNVDIVEAHEDAANTVQYLLDLGYDPERIVASFSGSKGFHIQVDSSQMGMLPFKDSDAARAFIVAWTKSVCDRPFWDSAVASPRSLIRVTGSTHEKSGIKKHSFLAHDFLRLGMNGVMKNVRGEYEGFDWPSAGVQLEDPHVHFLTVGDQAVQNYRQQRKGQSQSRSAGVLSNIRYGVSQGEVFGDKYFHVGRENAAFVAACALIDRCGTMATAKHKLRQWNGLNDPPLPRQRLMAQWRGAKRKLKQNRSR